VHDSARLEGHLKARGAGVGRSEIDGFLDRRRGVEADGVHADRIADLIDGLEDAAEGGSLRQGLARPLDDPIAIGFSSEGAA